MWKELEIKSQQAANPNGSEDSDRGFEYSSGSNGPFRSLRNPAFSSLNLPSWRIPAHWLRADEENMLRIHGKYERETERESFISRARNKADQSSAQQAVKYNKKRKNQYTN